MDRLLPDPEPTTLAAQLAGYEPATLAGAERPYVFTNFALTVDGRATIGGRSGPIGSAADTELLMGLRGIADAVLIGAGTMRTERYGRILPSAELRAGREHAGRSPDPLAVILTASMELPWEAGLFTCGSGEVVIFTSSDERPPACETAVEVVRSPGTVVDLADALGRLRAERGVGALLCEGGPRLHGELIAAGLVDELFITFAPKLAGGAGLRLVEALEEEERPLELRWLLREGEELFARYAVA